MNTIRFNRDIMVVPVKQGSLVLAQTMHFYVCPSNYVAKNPKMIAFYVGGEIGAITHAASIQTIETNVPRERIRTNNKQADTSKWERYETYKVFHLTNMIELEKPIRRSKVREAGIQNRIYSTFHRFSDAKRIDDLVVNDRK